MVDHYCIFVFTLQKLNLFIFTCVFVISEGYTANMQRSRSTFPHTSNSSLTLLHPHPIVKSESNRNSRCFPAFCFSLLPSHHLHRVRAPPELSMTPWRSWSPMSRTLPSGESLVITNSLIQWPTILL